MAPIPLITNTLLQVMKRLKPLLKTLLMLGLVFLLSFGPGNDALAARSGGRMGGGSFRAPSRSLPSRTAPAARPGGYGYGGGGFGFPFLIPFFGFGGGFGGLFTLLIGFTILNFVINAFRKNGFGTGDDQTADPTVTVAQVQVGLLAQAQELKADLAELARTADTGTSSGRAQLLQATGLALLRHPDYWVYGATQSQITPLSAAESQFNQLALTERSKFTAETLSNVDRQLQQLELKAQAKTDSLAQQVRAEVGEYLVVTLIVGIEGKLELPKVQDAPSLKAAVQQISGIGGDRLLAVEILWTPQAAEDTLTTEDILAHYPNLNLV